MNIDFKDYLSEDEVKEIVSDTLREEVRKHFRDEENAKRLINNISHQVIWDEVDIILPNSKQIVIDNVVKTIKEKEDMSFYVFYNGDYGKKSLGYQIMEDTVRDNKEAIKENISRTIINFDYKSEVWDLFEKLGTDFMDIIYKVSSVGRSNVTPASQDKEL